MNYIKGNYRKSIFESEKGYVIGLFKIKETDNEELKMYINKIITFTGYFDKLNIDDLYCFKGDIVEHPKYGLQFNVSEYERLKPDDEDGLVAFLSSDLFKGVGEKLAKSIVDTLGKNVLDEILKDESCLLLVPKMTNKKAHTIYETLMKYEESHQIIVYLTELGFNMKDALEIYNTYKSDTIIHIEHNPYCLTEFISFLKVDEIALKLNIDILDERRIKACIIYMMNKLIFTNSDTYLEYDEILESVFNYLKSDLNVDDFDLYLEELINENKIILIDNKYYLKEMYDSEVNIVNVIKYLSNKKIDKLYLDNRIEELEHVNNIKYNDKQKEAIKKSLENNITIITGGPGTGKTTIIKAICELYQNIFDLSYEELTNRIALLAPTGRASKRMSESTNLPASTIHRFLKWNKETNEFSVNEYNKNNHHLIIIDEVSMIDLSLLNNLFKGLTKNIKLILVGDHHQLPSVGPGNILKDLIASELIDTIYLDTLYRQDENSYITILAHEIKNNDLSNSFLETKSDYTFLKCHSIKDNLKKLCLQLVDKGYDYKRVQIMAPMYAGVNGIDNLNVILQNIYNPNKINKNEIVYGDVIYREKDKVLQLVNDLEKNVFNGDIGFIKKIDDKEITINFEGNEVVYTKKDLKQIKHAYAITIHKSQGSEFDHVIMPMVNNYYKMLYNKLIYTGVSRAKKTLTIIGDASAFVRAVNNNYSQNRKTTLKDNILEVYNLKKVS